jgi:hypothetical protein
VWKLQEKERQGGTTKERGERKRTRGRKRTFSSARNVAQSPHSFPPSLVAAELSSEMAAPKAAAEMLPPFWRRARLTRFLERPAATVEECERQDKREGEQRGNRNEPPLVLKRREETRTKKGMASIVSVVGLVERTGGKDVEGCVRK